MFTELCKKTFFKPHAYMKTKGKNKSYIGGI